MFMLIIRRKQPTISYTLIKKVPRADLGLNPALKAVQHPEIQHNNNSFLRMFDIFQM